MLSQSDAQKRLAMLDWRSCATSSVLKMRKTYTKFVLSSYFQNWKDSIVLVPPTLHFKLDILNTTVYPLDLFKQELDLKFEFFSVLRETCKFFFFRWSSTREILYRCNEWRSMLSAHV